MPKTSTDTTLRYLAMLQLVPAAPGRISVADLRSQLAQREYKVTSRTIQRDLERLSGTFPITCDLEGRTNHWYFSDKTSLQQIPAMSDATALALKLAEDYLSPIMPPTSLRLLRLYFRHAQEVLDKTRLGKWRSKVRMIRRGPQLLPPAIRSDVQEAVYRALLEGKQLQIHYKRRGESDEVERVLHPLGLVARDGIFYVVATAWNYDKPLHFTLHRIGKAEVLSLPSRVPANFNLERHVEEDSEFAYPASAGKIKLKAVVNRHLAEHLAECPVSVDQDLICRKGKWNLSAVTKDTEELRWWLLSLGSAIVVTHPKSLRREMQCRIREAAHAYEDSQ